ncbi:hypothetical protein [Kordia sp.]|uniref:hypothetical protein n=1 Tax=Kordia sp. TaxID=1965332 RepID=UPI003D6C6D76
MQQTFQVLGIHFSSEAVVTYYLLTIHKKKDDFTVGKCLETTSLDVVYKESQSKHPLLVHFSGVGILHKKVVRAANYRKKLLFKGNPDDFYFYELHQDEHIFVSMCRKKMLDKHIAQFEAKKYHILDIAIGPFITYALRSFLSEKNIVSNQTKLVLSQDKLTDFEINTASEEEQYIIEDLKFNGKDIALFAMVIQYHVQEEVLSMETSFLTQNRTGYTFFNATKAVGVIGLVLLLSAILFGHFTLEKYQDVLAEKKAFTAKIAEASNTVALLEKEKKNKETIVATSGLFHPKFLTQYFYEIGNSVEKNIKLSEINITPLTKKMRDDKEVQFYKKQIHVKGITSNDSDFNHWITILTEKEWVQKIDIEAYAQDRNRKKTFVIHIYF